MSMSGKLMVGNWKMNGSLTANASLLSDILNGMGDVSCLATVCLPAPYLAQAQSLLAGSALKVGAQDVSAHESGAYTGEVSCDMLRDFAVRYAIVGHSERRQYHGETDAVVAYKAQRALAAGISPIVCVGETLAEREANITEQVVETQLRGSLAGLTAEQVESTVLAYEPVWAIGTGKTASSAQAQEVHAFIRKVLVSMHGEAIARRVRIQYGGSVKGSNARELLQQPDIDGALVGGASLESKGFVEIIKNSI